MSDAGFALTPDAREDFATGSAIQPRTRVLAEEVHCEAVERGVCVLTLKCAEVQRVVHSEVNRQKESGVRVCVYVCV